MLTCPCNQTLHIDSTTVHSNTVRTHTSGPVVLANCCSVLCDLRHQQRLCALAEWLTIALRAYNVEVE